MTVTKTLGGQHRTYAVPAAFECLASNQARARKKTQTRTSCSQSASPSIWTSFFYVLLGSVVAQGKKNTSLVKQQHSTLLKKHLFRLNRLFLNWLIPYVHHNVRARFPYRMGFFFCCFIPQELAPQLALPELGRRSYSGHNCV